MEKEFTYDGKKYTCTKQDILNKCGVGASELVRCRKDRYGFDVVYKMKSGYYDDRDSALVRAFINYGCITNKKQK